jgi:hypothetical protein
VGARLSAAEIVVVQGGQVVVDEAERVHELERARYGKQLLGLTSESFPNGEA